MNVSKLVFSDALPFKVLSVDSREDELRIYVQPIARSAICPNCCVESKRIHSYYTRKIADLPVFGKTSAIFLRSRKFYCRQDECPFKVFTERFEHHFKPYRRKTNRLESNIQQLGLLAGGRPTERICQIMSMPASDTTILRLVKNEVFYLRKVSLPLGWTTGLIKNGIATAVYLSILIQGNLSIWLPDRKEETLRKWLEKRPEIEVMSQAPRMEFETKFF